MRPSFEELHSWFELLVRRLALSKVSSHICQHSSKRLFWNNFSLLKYSGDHNYYFKLPVPPEVASVREEVWERYGLDHLNSIDDLSEIEESSANITSCTEEGEDLSS